jgi:hypothetical protein
MNSTTSWNPDEFKEEIGILISKFNTLFLEDVSALLSNPNGNRKISVKALASLDLVKVQSHSHQALANIEDKLRHNASIILAENNFNSFEISSYLNEYFGSGFIKSQIINELNSTLNQLNELTNLANSHLSVLEANSGFSGVVRGFFKGYSNPIDGVSHVFGQGSMQIEVNSSTQGFNTAVAFVVQSIDAVSNSLQQIILQKWNHFGAMVESV